MLSAVIFRLVSLIWTCTEQQAFQHVSLCRSIFPSGSPQQNKRLPHGENERCLSYVSNHFVLSNFLPTLHLSICARAPVSVDLQFVVVHQRKRLISLTSQRKEKCAVHWKGISLWYLRTTPDLKLLLFVLY